MTRQEWLNARKNGIGGSDASCIVGKNPYKSNIELFKEKTGQIEPEDISEKPYVKYGTQAEEHLRELFILDFPKYKVIHKENNMIFDPEYPFMFASLDGELIDLETGEKGILEIKTTNILQSMQKEKWKEKIPDNYYIQILHYLMVTGFGFVVLKAQLKYEYKNKETNETEIRLSTVHYFIKREDVENDIAYLREKEIVFWKEYVEKGKTPPLILPTI